MGKAQRERALESRRTRTDEPFIPPKYQHLVAVGILFLSLIIFFAPVIFGNKTYLDVDTIASHSFDTFLADARKEGVFPLWNPYIFCGMPAYGSLTVTGDRVYDISAYLLSNISVGFQHLLLQAPVGWVLFYYLIFGGGLYWLTLNKTGSKVSGVLAALAATFSTYIIIWVMVGHTTKIAVMAWFPYVFLIVERLRERFDLKLVLALVLLLHFMYLPAHVQMIFYVYFALGVYILFFLIRSVVKKEDWKGVARAGIVLGFASVVAFSMDSDRYLSVLEYNPYSIRGSGPIAQASGKESGKSPSGGLDYDYATNWSLAPGEVVSFVIPFWNGFGYHMYQGPLTQDRPQRVNTYAGPQPFTHAAQYVGIVVFALAVVGFVRNRKNPFVQFLAVVIVVSLLVAFGKEFSLVYDLLFTYLPGFNKFRIPSMIVVLIQIFIPILAGYGFASLINMKEEPGGVQRAKKRLKSLGAAAVILLLVLMATYESLLSKQEIQNMLSSFFNLNLPRDRVVDEVFRQVPPNIVQELTDHAASMVRIDLFVGLALLAAVSGSMVLFWQDRMKASTVGVVVIACVVFDLWRIDSKPVEAEDRKGQSQIFTAPDYAQYIQKDTSLFRTLTFINGQPPYDNTLAYWRIQNAYGYQGAKMRAFQDIVDVVGLYNPLLWQLMNVKYIAANKPDSSEFVGLVYNGQQMKVYATRGFLPRAFFVNRYQVAGGLAILENMRTLAFGAQDIAYFLDDPKLQIDPPKVGARAEFVRYGIQDFKMAVTATGNNLLFISETYYPEGWKAFVDGNETKIYRLNYLFRGVVVPSGTHTLVMKFEPRGFYLGKNLSLAVNIVLLAAFAFFGVNEVRKRRKPRGGTEESRSAQIIGG